MEVICGATRKTIAKLILMKFDFSINFNYTADQDKQQQLLKELDDQIYEMLDEFDKDLQSGLLDIDTMQLQSQREPANSLGAGFDCEEGTIPNDSRFTCGMS